MAFPLGYATAGLYTLDYAKNQKFLAQIKSFSFNVLKNKSKQNRLSFYSPDCHRTLIYPSTSQTARY